MYISFPCYVHVGDLFPSDHDHRIICFKSLYTDHTCDVIIHKEAIDTFTMSPPPKKGKKDWSTIRREAKKTTKSSPTPTLKVPKEKK